MKQISLKPNYVKVIQMTEEIKFAIYILSALLTFITSFYIFAEEIYKDNKLASIIFFASLFWPFAIALTLIVTILVFSCEYIAEKTNSIAWELAAYKAKRKERKNANN